MNRTKSRRGQPNTALTVHGLLTIQGPNLNRCENMIFCEFPEIQQPRRYNVCS